MGESARVHRAMGSGRTLRLHRSGVLAAAGIALALSLGPAFAAPSSNDYGDPAYLQHDLDNIARSSIGGAQVAQLLDPTYHATLFPLAAETWLENVGEQLAGLPQGRVYGGIGHLVPGGAVGDPWAYHDVEPIEVSFVSRTGAELQGHLFWDGQPGAHPGAVITTGSIQGMQQAYWWAARTLARNGYLVLTFDVQGQGDSDVFGHDPGSAFPNLDGVPFQQEANFVDGTVDAIRFLLSTEEAPYLPAGWSPADADAVRTQGQGTIVWANPLAAFLDPSRIGLAGHSLGARAVSVVQQCSDEGAAWTVTPACGGQAYPIKGIVAWDGLSDDVTPVVPAMDQRADGYFANPVPAFQAPDAGSHLTSFDTWRRAGLDAYSFTVRGGTHIEWVTVPYVLTSTTYGVRQADFYTLAWFDRYVTGDAARRAVGAEALVAGPIPDGATGGADELAWRANFFSARYRSAFAFTDDDGGFHHAEDLRAYAGQSPVGDWAGANADRPNPRQ